MLVNQDRLNQDDADHFHSECRIFRWKVQLQNQACFIKNKKKLKKDTKGVFRQEGYPSLCFNYSRRGLRSHRRSPDNSNARIQYLYLHAGITEQTSSFKSSYANGWHLKQTLHEKRTYNKRLGFFFSFFSPPLFPAVKLAELFHIHEKAS